MQVNLATENSFDINIEEISDQELPHVSPWPYWQSHLAYQIWACTVGGHDYTDHKVYGHHCIQLQQPSLSN